jgi:hypothetical protein
LCGWGRLYRASLASLQPARDPLLEGFDFGIGQEWRPRHRHARLAVAANAAQQFAVLRRAGDDHLAACATLE